MDFLEYSDIQAEIKGSMVRNLNNKKKKNSIHFFFHLIL